MNVVFIGDIVVVMVVGSLAHFQVEEADASGQAAQVCCLDVLLTEEVQDLGGLGVVEAEDLGAGQLGGVAAVGNWTRVVVRVELVEEHSYWICYVQIIKDQNLFCIYTIIHSMHSHSHHQLQSPNQVKILKQDRQQSMSDRQTIRLRVKTNKFLDMIVAIEVDKSVRELAHRVLHCFHELADQHASIPPKRRDLTVSALKIDNYFISKTEIVGNMLKDNDQIQCVLSKAKPKFPNCPMAYERSFRQSAQNFTFNYGHSQRPTEKRQTVAENSREEGTMFRSKKKEKKQLKKEKKKQKADQMVKYSSNLQARSQSPYLNQVLNIKPHIEDEKDDSAYIIYKERPKESPQVSQFDNGNHEEPTVQVLEPSKIASPRQKTPSPSRKPEQNEATFRGEKPSIESQSQPIDPIASFSLNSSRQELNGSVETRKEEPAILPTPAEEGKKKKKNGNSILEILSKATEEKEKKVKRKDKKGEKVEETQSESKINQTANQSSLGNPLKILKGQKQPSTGNKIASPKVTFHSSPLLSPQVINLNSPKRKISNPAIEKIELEAPLQLNPTKSKKQAQKQKKPSQKPQVLKKQKLPSSAPKIIVEEDSQQSCQVSTKAKDEQKQPETSSSSKLAALNAKISKYKLEFFNDNQQDDE